MRSSTGALVLVRFHLRRDRLMLVLWILGGVLLYYSQAVGTDGLYSTQAQLDRAAAKMESNAAFIAMAGPARALDSVGGQVAWQAGAFGSILAGLMSMFLVGRHTRAEEESGRDELVRAAAVGRNAPLVAAAVTAAIANVLLGALVAASLASYGLPVMGSVVLGTACALTGGVFGAVALVAAQLASSTRAVYAITGAVIGLSYLLRAIGDVGDGALSWLSPIGWGQYMRAFAGDSWWPALLSLVTTTVLALAAVALSDRRDLGSGVISPRPGPSRGALDSTVGLAWRVQRSSVVGWTVGLLVGGLAFGSIGDNVQDLIGDSHFSHEVFVSSGVSLLDSFYATLATMLALIVTGFAVSSVLRLRSEESEHFAELLLSTAVSRRRWALSHLAITLAGTVAAMAAAGVGLGLGFFLVTQDDRAALRLLGVAGQYVVPVLVVAALTWLAYAVRSTWGMLGFVVLGFSAVVLLFGEVLRLPAWLMGVSPFHHLAVLPTRDFDVTSAVVMVLLIAAAVVAGDIVLRRRDIG